MERCHPPAAILAAIPKSLEAISVCSGRLRIGHTVTAVLGGLELCTWPTRETQFTGHVARNCSKA
eukprot:328839-Amorphochlora_amoeboformis.AAC.1